MKKLLFFVTMFAFAIVADAQTRRTNSVDGSEDTSVNRTLTNGVDKLLGSSTTQIITTKDADGNAITLIPINKGTRFCGWHVIVARDGQVLVDRTLTKKRFHDPGAAIAETYQGYYSGRGNGNRLLNTVSNIYHRAQGYGIVNGSRIVW